MKNSRLSLVIELKKKKEKKNHSVQQIHDRVYKIIDASQVIVFWILTNLAAIEILLLFHYTFVYMYFVVNALTSDRLWLDF